LIISQYVPETFSPQRLWTLCHRITKDSQTIARINKVIDHDTIKNIVSTEISNSYKALQNKLQKKDDEIADLEHKSTLKLEGIVEPHNENPFETILNACSYLQLDPPITLGDIDNCHRVGRVSEDGRPRVIIAKFTSYRARKRLYDARTYLCEHNKRLMKAKSQQHQTDEVFEDRQQPTDAVPPVLPPVKPHGRRPDPRVLTRNESTPIPERPDSAPLDIATLPDKESPSEDNPNSHEDDNPPEPAKFISSWPVFINEALCKTRSDLSYEARKLKKER